MKKATLLLLALLLLFVLSACTQPPSAPEKPTTAAATTTGTSATVATVTAHTTTTVTTTTVTKATTTATSVVNTTTTAAVSTTVPAPITTVAVTTTTTQALQTTTTTAATAGTYPTDRKLVIACVGDSITECEYWKDNFFGLLPTDRYTVKPFGLSGATAIKSHNNAYINAPKFARSKSSKPDIVIIMLGTNDSRASVWDRASNAGGEEFIRDYLELIEAYRNLPTHPTVMIALPPTVHKDYTGITENYVANKVIPAVYEVGRRAGVTVIDVHTPTADDAAEFWYDGCHPSTEAGKKAIGEPIAAAILAEVND